MLRKKKRVLEKTIAHFREDHSYRAEVAGAGSPPL
jgi:hypothetical protein